VWRENGVSLHELSAGGTAHAVRADRHGRDEALAGVSAYNSLKTSGISRRDPPGEGICLTGSSCRRGGSGRLPKSRRAQPARLA